MRDMTTHTGKLEIVQRLPSSKYGNPRWLVRVDGWTCRTKPDCSLGYSITNLHGKTVRATIGTYRGNATLAWAEPA